MGKSKLTDSDYCRAAYSLGCEPAMIAAVAEQESLGAGFDSQDRPTILFERHIFHRLTGGKFDSSHPNISNDIPGGYGRSREQYGRFSEAFALNPDAAMKATSWGKFQILGRNFAICGFQNVGAFVDAMKESEAKQLDAFCAFCTGNRLDQYLTDKDAAGFADGYNGHGYRKNHYDDKIEAGYKVWKKHNFKCSNSAANLQNPASDEVSKPSLDPTILALDPNNAPPTDSGSTTVTKAVSSTGESILAKTTTNDANVAVGKEEQTGFFTKIKLKGAAWLAWLGGLTGINEYKHQIDDLGLPGWIILYVIIGTVVAIIFWLIYEFVMHILEWWGKRKRTDVLAQVNSTPTNTVTIVPQDQLDAFEKLGWVVIRRNQ